MCLFVEIEVWGVKELIDLCRETVCQQVFVVCHSHNVNKC